ncbi:mitochondrial carrier superfamily protein [Toxoplasma gondii VAND]|uniref:Mitochondrial carrier superfamily protein n=1 Tax=Toxoplasma gondii VAND TaxID=933077 RepID=A0A086PS95_TOXGO|nr:mitochondrial carrier superfamily protein [Toxoplasma gondii VAND]
MADSSASGARREKATLQPPAAEKQALLDFTFSLRCSTYSPLPSPTLSSLSPPSSLSSPPSLSSPSPLSSLSSLSLFHSSHRVCPMPVLAGASAGRTPRNAPPSGPAAGLLSAPYRLLLRPPAPVACSSLPGSAEKKEGNGRLERTEEETKSARMNSGIAGAVSGIVCASILQPLDVIKTQQQQQQPVTVGGVRQRPSVAEVCRRIHSMWGFQGFFRGLWPCLIRVGPGTGVYFYSLDMLTGSWGSFATFSRKAAEAVDRRFSFALSEGKERQGEAQQRSPQKKQIAERQPEAEGEKTATREENVVDVKRDKTREKTEETGSRRAAEWRGRIPQGGECACETTATLVHAAAEETAATGFLLEGEAEREVSREVNAETVSPTEESPGPAPPWYNAAVGAVARGVAVVFFNPITVVKSRVESSWMTSRSSPPINAVLREMWRTEGPASLLRGAWPTVLRDVPFSGIFFGLYTWLRTQAGMDGARQDISYFALKNFCCGASAAALASAVTHPFDVVRTRIQLYGLYVAQQSAGGDGAFVGNSAGASRAPAGPGPGRNGGAKVLTMRNMMREMVREEGVVVLWRGLAARLAKRSLMSAMTWTSFEELRVLLGDLKR